MIAQKSSFLKKTSIAAIALSTLVQLGFASDLKAPIDLSSAKVLPKGVRNLRYKGVLVEANDKFDNASTTKLVADPFFKTLNWRDITDAKVDATTKGTLLGYLQANGYNLDETVGGTTGAVSVAATGHVPVMAYGITEKLTTAIAIPIIKYKFQVDTGFVSNPNMEKLAAQLQQDQKTFELSELKEKMADPIGTKLKDFNYKPLKNEEGTKLGDIKLVNKYSLKSSETLNVAMQGEVTLPTGQTADIDKVVDVAPGDGQWDVGFSFLTDYSPIDTLTFTSSFGYTAQLADTTAKRIPYRSDSTVSPDVDKNVKRDLGDVIMGQVGAKYEPLKGFTISPGVGFQLKDKDKYSGSAYDSGRYQWMEAQTRQRMLTGQVGLGYSTLRLFKEKKFPVPLEANINHSFVMSGKNVTKDPTTSFEFVMFF